MKRNVTIVRIIVGVLFIFSGVIKAVDPLGLAYKMQEFFQVWSTGGHVKWLWNWLGGDHATMIMSSIIIVLEVGVGMAILVGWQKRFTLRLIFILSIFFTFLTGYAYFSGKVNECGCFGTCIPLSAFASFIKDIVLLVLIVFLMIKKQYIEPAFKSIHMVTLMLGSIMLTAFLQSHALEHLPFIDCLPYKPGNDILKLRQMPADATFDDSAVTFLYKKGIDEKEFIFPNSPDTTWHIVEGSRATKLISKGNGKLPLINDFSLTDINGNDSTEAILGQKGKYYLMFLKNMSEETGLWESSFNYFYQNVKLKKRNVYVVIGNERLAADSFFNIKNTYNIPVYSCDVTAVKTAARCTPTVFLMDGPVIVGKWSWLDISDALQQ